ncbi:cation-translocating P-type ATPase [Sphingomonas aerophila]|nr:HAD-IC family P-type ATPase [Sphingomonas aerophila]
MEIAPARTAAWHSLTAQNCLERLNSSPAGLSLDGVAARRRQFGRNEMPRPRQPSWATLFVRQFRSPLIYLLLGAAILAHTMGEAADTAFILAVLFLNALIGAIQEGRAGASAEALERIVRQTARAEREGQVIELDAGDLVPGDLVLVESGAAVPADLRLVAGSNVLVNESLLTREAMPVAKLADASVPALAAVADRETMLHAGTTIVSGRAKGVVVAIGMHTQLGAIGTSLRSSNAPLPPLMTYMKRLSRQIGLMTVILVGVLAVTMLVRGTAPDQILLLAVALAVSAIPEGLPVAVTVALAVAGRRMAARHVIVRTLPAVEGLGACTVIATDKTGTLTLNRLSVEIVLTETGEQIAPTSMGASIPTLRRIAWAAAACNEASRSSAGEIIGDSVDVALLRFAEKAGGMERNVRLALMPYEPKNRFASVAVRSESGIDVLAKGAVETILPMCDAVDDRVHRAAERLATDGYRVLALAGTAVADVDAVDLAHPNGLALIGLVGLLDPLRPEAGPAIRACRSAGIRVCMVTGDHPATAMAIARQLGLAHRDGQLLTGAEMERLATNTDALQAAVRGARIFARMDPSQKLTLVEALRADGEVATVTGDGVNDAPALQAADLGVAMGLGGTDVARGAADLILTDDNFASIVAGVEEGRVAFANIRKVTMFVLGTGLAEIGTFVVALLAGLPMPMTAVQLLWANLITESAQTAALALGRGEGDELARKPRASGGHVVDRAALALLLPPAIAMAAFAGGLFCWELSRGNTVIESRGSVLLATVLFQNIFALTLRSEGRPIWRERLTSNPWLLLGVAAALLIQSAAFTITPLAGLLGIVPPDLASIVVCIGGAVLTLAAAEAAKFARRGRALPQDRLIALM